MAVILCWLLVIRGIGFFKILRAGIALFIANRNMAVKLFKTAQSILFKAGLMLSSGNIPIGYKNGITGMVVGLVKRLKLIVAQVRDIGRLTATL